MNELLEYFPRQKKGLERDFAYWYPETMVFNQQENGKNSSGTVVGFSNVDLVNYDYSYYYGKEDPGNDTVVDGVAYPLYFRKFVLSDTTD